MKKKLCLLLAVLMAVAMVPLGGCSSSGSSSKGVLNVFNWTEYMPDSVYQKFEKETGIKVNYSTYSTNEDMLNKVKTDAPGTYDIVIPSDYMVEQMIKQGLLEELDMSKIPNLKNINPNFLNQTFDPNNKHSVPYMGGCATLVVNTKKITEKITSFKQIFDPKYKDSIVALDDFRAVIGMTAKSLGYSMSETDDTKLAEIQKKLLELKPNMKAFDSDNPKALLISGEASIGFVWNAEIALAMAENPDLQIVFPDEGTYLFLDNMCIPKDAKNKENAEKFINFILDPANSKMISDAFPYLNPNAEAIKLMGDSYKNNPASNPPDEVLKKGEFIKDIGDKVEVYDKMWTELTK